LKASLTAFAPFLRANGLDPDDYKLVIEARSREHREELADTIQAEIGAIRGLELDRRVTSMNGAAAGVPFTLV
jgi:hypothetical protein